MKTQKQKPRGKAFSKGNPGRPKGAENKATTEVRELARKLIEDGDYREKLRARLLAGEAGQVEVLLWYYAYGKPKETLEVESQEINFVMCLTGKGGRHAAECKHDDAG